MPAVTAVIPCFNAAPWIRRSLASILGQSRPVDEIIVVDDGSTDSSCEIVEEHAVRLVRLGTHRGVSAARNAGLDAATHPLVAWLDADDYWDPHHCATVMPLLARHAEAAVAFSRVRFAMRPRRPPWGRPIECRGPLSLFEQSLGRCVVPIMASVCRREAARAIGGFREELSAAVDFDFFLRLSSRYPFVWSSEVTATYHWRLFPTQISTDQRTQHRCHWRSRLLFWRELEATGDADRAARVLVSLRDLWARDLASCWRRRDLAAIGALFELPAAEVLDGALGTRLRALLA